VDWLSVCARLLLVVVFAAAAAGKLLDRAGTARALRDFKVPESAVPALSIALPFAESVVALGMVFAQSARWAGAAAILLLGLFILKIAGAMRRGETPDCHCFGQLHSEPAGVGTLVRNGLLVAVAAVVILDDSPPQLAFWLGERNAIEIVAVFAGVGLVCAASVVVRRAVGDRDAPKPLDVGVRPPALSAFDATGATVTIDRLVVPGRPCLLAFVSPQCGPCVELLPDLARWQRSLDGRR